MMLTTRSGKSYQWNYVRTKNGARASLIVTTDVPISFSLEEEKWFQRFAKKLGFATEFQTGDTQFDKQVYILSDSSDFCNRLRSDDVLRKLCVQLFTVGDCIKVDAGKGRIEVAWRQAQITLDPDTAEAMVTCVYDIARHLSTLQYRTTQQDHVRRIASMTISGLFMLTLFGGFIGMAAIPYHSLFPLEIAKQVGMYLCILVPLTLFLLNVLFGGSSHGLTTLKFFLLFGIAGLGVTTATTLLFVNYKYDTSAAESHLQRIVNKHESHSRKGGTSYHLRLTNWYGASAPFSLRVDSSVYYDARIGDTVKILTHPGYLGHEWIEGYEVLR